MNRRTLLVISAIIFVALSITYDNFHTNNMIVGTYSYDYPGLLAEGPKRADQLILQENGKFESDTWGKGVYELDGSRLQLSYDYEFGKAGYDCSISRRFF